MRIIIIGAGGHGRVVLDILRRDRHFEVAGFLDDNSAMHRQFIDKCEVLGDISLVNQFDNLGIDGAVIAIGDNRIRDKYAQKLEKFGVFLFNAIHPTATIADNTQIGKNVVITAGTIVCTNATIEDSVILNAGSIIGYDSTIHKAAHICPGAKLAHNVTIKESAFIGIGSTIIEGITVGDSAIVGAGAVVLQDVPAFSTVVGVPGSVVKASHIKQLDNDLLPSTADLEPARSLVKRPKRLRPDPVPIEAHS